MSYAAMQNTTPHSGGGGSGFTFRSAWRNFLRRIPLMLIIFALLAGLGWYFGGQLKRTYSADGRLLVTQGPEHSFKSLDGSAGGSLMITPDSITQSEIGILKNPELIDRVMLNIGMDKLFPETYAKFAVAQRQNNRALTQDLQAQMIKQFDSAFYVAAKSKSYIIDVSFKHENPSVAQTTLDMILDEYDAKRKELFVEGASTVISDQRASTETQLATIDRAIARFMAKNEIGDFESERTGVRKRTEDLRAELNTLLGNIRQSEVALMSIENSLRQTVPTIDLQVEDRASQRVAQAELERKQLLAKYLPTSDPVKAKDREIRELRQLIAGANGKAVGGRRVGPNPVYQALETQRNTLQSQADSYREKEFTVRQLLNTAATKTARLTSLDPTYQNLLREKKALETRLSALNLREQDALVKQANAQSASENVKIINHAGLPRKGRNMKKIVQFLSIVGAGITAVLFGLLGVFLDPSTYGAPTRARSKDMRTRQSDTAPSPIPEAVPANAPAYAPIPAPVPAYAPAAAVAGHGLQEYDPAAYAGYGDYTPIESTPYAPQNYGAPTEAPAYAPQAYETQSHETPYGDPYGAQAGAPYPEAQAAYPAPAPIGAEGPQPYDPATHGGETRYVDGPGGTQIPVLGQAAASR